VGAIVALGTRAQRLVTLHWSKRIAGGFNTPAILIRPR
jgi:hypothetical protein